MIRYIHLNPVRAKIVDDPQHYSWSSHQAYLMQKEFTWLARDAGLQFFGESRHEALGKYRSFVLSGIGVEEDIDIKKGMKAGIIADDLLSENIREKFDSYVINEIRPVRINLKILLTVVADWYQIDISTFPTLGNTRRASQIRGVMAHLARSIGGVSLKEVAEVCGRAENSMSQAGQAWRLK